MPDIFVAKEKKEEKLESIKKPEVKTSIEKKTTKTESVAEQLKSQRTTNPLSALIIRPKNLSFDTQEKEEKIIFLARRHLITNLKWILIALVMLLLPSIIFRFSPEFFANFQYRSLLALIWYLLTFSYVFQNFLLWVFNVHIVTDERIVDIDFPNILYRDISSAKIDMVQDVSAKTGGFLRSLFNFGDVYIQTAGEKREFLFEAIPQPDRVIEILNQLILEEEQEKLEGRVR